MAKTKFTGESEISIEDAISWAIAMDPKGDPGTDIFTYDVEKIKVSWGGFAERTSYKVILNRTVIKGNSTSNLLKRTMDAIETFVKTQIAFVARLQRKPEDIADSTTLSAFRYNETMIVNLEQILDEFVKKQNAVASIQDDDIDSSKTCGDVVQLVRDKIAGK